jgi:hypothetical protein
LAGRVGLSTGLGGGGATLSKFEDWNVGTSRLKGQLSSAYEPCITTRSPRSASVT